MSQQPLLQRISPAAFAAMLTVACLLPFINKAVHVDDTVYLWVAEQIRQAPLDFFGFEKNWYLNVQPMYEINMNPPGTSYVFAIASLFVGFGVVGLHLVQIVIAAIAAVGFVRLAEIYDADSRLVAAAAILTPAFVVTGTTLMCEPAVIACYVWSLVLWIQGIDNSNSRKLAAACTIAGFGVLFKYIVITALPLLAAYAIVSERKLSKNLLFLAIPVFLVSAYEAYTFARYDAGAFAVAASYALDSQNSPLPQDVTAAGRGLTTVAYLGGGLASVLLLAPWMWTPRQLAKLSMGMAGLTAFFALPITIPLFDSMLVAASHEATLPYRIQFGFWTGAGIHVLGLAAYDLAKSRDPKSLVLALLVGGIFVFSGYVNWSTNIRSLIPALPAAALLVARQMERNADDRIRVPMVPGLAAAAVLALATAWADYEGANLDRRATATLAANYDASGTTIWYFGHWGMRWYLGESNWRALELNPIDEIPPSLRREMKRNPGIRLTGLFAARQGEYLVVAEHHAQYAPTPDVAELVGEQFYQPRLPLATHNYSSGAGFYATRLGILPFVFGTVEPNIVRVYRFRRDVRTIIAQR